MELILSQDQVEILFDLVRRACPDDEARDVSGDRELFALYDILEEVLNV